MRPLIDASPPVTGRVDSLPQGARRRCDALFAAMSGCSVSLVGGSETSDAGLESSEDGWPVTKSPNTLRTGTGASMPQSSAGPENGEESAMSNEQVTPAETKGVAVEVLATVDLAEIQ